MALRFGSATVWIFGLVDWPKTIEMHMLHDLDNQLHKSRSKRKIYYTLYDGVLYCCRSRENSLSLGFEIFFICPVRSTHTYSGSVIIKDPTKLKQIMLIFLSMQRVSAGSQLVGRVQKIPNDNISLRSLCLQYCSNHGFWILVSKYKISNKRYVLDHACVRRI